MIGERFADYKWLSRIDSLGNSDQIHRQYVSAIVDAANQGTSGMVRKNAIH
jgi:hypothetical protein